MGKGKARMRKPIRLGVTGNCFAIKVHNNNNNNNKLVDVNICSFKDMYCMHTIDYIKLELE